MAAFWSRYSTDENHQARSRRIGPPTEPPYCSRSNGGVGRVRLKVAGKRLQIAVALKDEQGAVILVRAGFGDDVDDAVAGAAHLGGEAPGRDLKLLDRIFRKV